MMGVRFEGHPNLRRVLLWRVRGHPLRKDYREPYYRGEPSPSRAAIPMASITRPRTAFRGKITSATRSVGTRFGSRPG